MIQIETTEVSALYKYAKAQFDLGDYKGAARNLFHYINLSLDSDGERLVFVRCRGFL